MSESFTTQATNFLSALSGSVDPRTGMYGYNISIAQLKGNAGLGPELPVVLSYSPLTTTNSGFGTGVSFPITKYDKGTRTLYLSTGEKYRVAETGNTLTVIHAKNINFKVSVDDDGYYIKYKSGVVEKLTSPSKGGNIKVTETISSPIGRSLSLTWELHGTDKRLINVHDEANLLLELVYNTAGVTFNVWPNTKEAHKVSINLQNNLLTSVINNSISPALTWSFKYTSNLLTSVISPTNSKDLVVYNQTGHHFPVGGPTSTLPFVSSFQQYSGDSNLITYKQYQFSDNNFLGHGSSNQTSWNSDTDFLYGVFGNYEYSSIETFNDKNGTPLATIERIYNNYHLLISEKKSLNNSTCSKITEKEYGAILGVNFDDQPAQFQCQTKETVIWIDTSKDVDSQQRTEITLTEYDDYCNPLKQIASDGTVTEYEYYPAEGDGELCPPDNNGFIRFRKKQIQYPRESDYKDVLPLISEYTYKVLGDKNGIVIDTQKNYHGELLLSEKKTNYNDAIEDFQFGRVTEIQNTIHSDGSSYPSSQIFTSTLTDGVLTQNVTFKGHDNLTSTHQKTLSSFSGLKLKETNEQDVTLEYTYDLLGRITSKTIAPETKYMHKMTWEYNIEDSGPVTITNDAIGNKIKFYFDGTGNLLSKHVLDTDFTNEFYEILNQDYDLLQRTLSVSATDWKLDTAELESYNIKQQFEFDNWGNVKSKSFSNGIVSYDNYDPISLTRQVYSSGEDEGKLISSAKTYSIYDSVSNLLVSEEIFDSEDTLYCSRAYSWDGYGRMRSQSDWKGNITESSYDAYNRVTTQTFPDSSTVIRAYAPHLTGNQIQSISIAANNENNEPVTTLIGTQSFDSLGRVVSEYVGGRTTTYEYEGASPVPAKVIYPSGTNIAYTYIPELGNVISNIVSEMVTQSFSYDNLTSNLLNATENDVINDNKWSVSGNLISEGFTRNDVEYENMHSYTLSGGKTSFTDVTNSTLTYTKDVYGRLIKISDDLMNTDIKYDPLGRLYLHEKKDTNTSSVMNTSLNFDEYGRETHRTIKDGDNILVVTQSYDFNSLLLTKVTVINEENVCEESFEYDERNRLIKYNAMGKNLPVGPYGHEFISEDISYDPLNNIKSIHTLFFDDNENTATYFYENSADPTQLTKIENSYSDYPQVIELTYDANGRMTLDDAGRKLVYDDLGRLVSISGEELGEGYYGYDALDKLVYQKINDSDKRNLFYNQDELVCEIKE